MQLQAKVIECSKFGRRAILHTFCPGENGSGAAEYRAREIAWMGISWIIMLVSVRIPRIWHPCTDRAVCQKWVAGTPSEECR
jgi:hypothetical protein